MNSKCVESEWDSYHFYSNDVWIISEKTQWSQFLISKINDWKAVCWQKAIVLTMKIILISVFTIVLFYPVVHNLDCSFSSSYPRHLVTYKLQADDTIKIDGRLDDQAWVDVQWSQDFQDIRFGYLQFIFNTKGSRWTFYYFQHYCSSSSENSYEDSLGWWLVVCWSRDGGEGHLGQHHRHLSLHQRRPGSDHLPR